MMPGGLAQVIIQAMHAAAPPPPKLSKKERKRERKRKAEWAESVMGGIDPHGMTLTLFVGGKPFMNNTAMAARVGLMLCEHSDALKASFAACQCPVCQKVAEYPAHAILGGFREWVGELVNGVHDGQDEDRLLAAILRKVEPS